MTSSVFKTTLLVLMAFAVTPGCVRLKDNDENDQDLHGVIKSYKTQNLTIDEPLYLVNGELVRRNDLAKVKERNNELPLGSQVEYELHFEHLNFKEGGVLYTMGQLVRIFVNDLDSRGGKIISLPDEAVAPIMAEGASGGSVYLQVQHARGDLGVFMVGGQGGQGIKGATGLTGVSSNGVEMRFSRDGAEIFCARGGPGGRGSTGAKGGPSGTAEIVVYDDSNFDLRVSRQGGRGGNGGDGGDGGRAGGPGNLCLDVYKEPRGDVGPRGAQGESGLVQNVCVQRGSGARQCM
ncbi:MAG: hypothetical protein ACM3MG_05785 [Bacillota bacterium]